MRIEYNGVTLELTEIVECQRDAVYDPSGTDLLYIKWRLGVVAMLGSGGRPQGTAVDWQSKAGALLNTKFDITGTTASINRDLLGANPADYEWDSIKQPDPIADPSVISNQAFITDHELKYRLMVPRRKLRVTAFGADGNEYVWLESPRPIRDTLADGVAGKTQPADFAQQVSRSDVDSDNGPKPLKCDIVSPAGEGNTFGVHFVIETCIPPCPVGSERLVLSHRWETSHGHNDDHYLTRVTKGEIRFNASLLHAGKQQPDWFRSQFFHPIPLGFRRSMPDVSLSSDGLVLRYETHDVDPTVVFDPGDSGATQMEIVETMNVLNRDMAAGHAMDLLGGILDSFRRAREAKLKNR